MRITNAILHDTIIKIAGEEALPIVEYIKTRKNISEFKVAEALELEINQVRRILYRLFDNSLCTYNRKKDSKKGWYISYWTFNLKRIKFVLENMKKNQLELLNKRLKRELDTDNNFYMCSNYCKRMTFHDAADIDFKCPECGKLLNHSDNTKTVQRIKDQISELEK